MISLDVFGMTCGGCENAVRRAILARDPGATVSASAADNRVTVETATLSPDEAVAAVTAAGYEAKAAN